MYKLQKDSLSEQIVSVQPIDKPYMSIPVNPDNTDYQEYLKWVELGNEPLPADE